MSAFSFSEYLTEKHGDDKEDVLAPQISVTAGQPLEEGATPATEEAVVEALRTVHDPEIPVNIFDLGLIYRLDIAADGTVDIDMTLTAPTCPVAGELPQEVADAAATVDGVGTVSVTLVWEPAWSLEKMSEEARMTLDLF